MYWISHERYRSSIFTRIVSSVDVYVNRYKWGHQRIPTFVSKRRENGCHHHMIADLGKEGNLPLGLLHSSLLKIPLRRRRVGRGGASRQGRHILVTLLDVLLLLGEVVPELVGNSQMILHNLLGGQSKPLSGTDISELLGLQDLEENHVLGTSVLNVVRSSLRNISDTAGREVEGTSSFGRLEDGDTGRTLQEVVPLGRSGVPVNFTHGTGLHGNERSGEVIGEGEGRRVEDLDRATRNLVRRLLRPVVGLSLECAIRRTTRGGKVLSVINCVGLRGAVEDLCGGWLVMLRLQIGRMVAKKNTHVKLIVGQLVEGTGIRLEVLGQDADGVANHHLGEQEGLILRK